MNPPENPGPLLAVSGLTIAFGDTAAAPVVEDMGYRLDAGETLGVVGESGSGKSVSSLALPGLLPPGARVLSGQAVFDGVDLLRLRERDRRRIRGARIGMIFQDALAALNPYLSIGSQVTEPLRLHRGCGRREAWRRAEALLARCGIDDVGRRMGQYPHEFSGGMRQRVMIAMALAAEPQLLIADEPTSALDVTVQQQVLELLAREQAERGFALLFISHDLAVIRQVASRVLVMERGRVVESGETGRILAAPAHPYTRSLVDSVPSGARDLPPRWIDADVGPVLDAAGLRVSFPAKGGNWLAVDDVSLVLRRGEVLGIVGESGSGKSTLMRALMRVQALDAGEIRLGNVALHTLRGAALRPYRRRMQMVFQDPYGSLDPRMTVHDCIAGVLSLHGLVSTSADAVRRVGELLAAVGIDPGQADRFPHEFSGGQRQRIAIARALAVEPEVLVADEPVSALDVTVQAKILVLLEQLVTGRGIAMIVVSHDLAVVRKIADRVAVMQGGRIRECGPTETVFSRPGDAYTRRLLDASVLSYQGVPK